MKLAIIGGGSWGTALAIVLAPRFESVTLWVYEADLAARMVSSRENDIFLPGLALPDRLQITVELATALEGADIVLGVMPSHHARGLYTAMLPHLRPSTILVSATKGLEQSSLLRGTRRRWWWLPPRQTSHERYNTRSRALPFVSIQMPTPQGSR